jgi:hypothetical protein
MNGRVRPHRIGRLQNGAQGTVLGRPVPPLMALQRYEWRRGHAYRMSCSGIDELAVGSMLTGIAAAFTALARALS